MTIDPVTGAITPSTSTAGTYTVTYTIPASGGCAAVPVITTVTITVVPTAAISYAGNPFCMSVSAPQPVTLNGTGAYLGGTYTAAPAGLTIDPVTGAITPSTSTAGNYTVTYTIPASGGCVAVPVTTTVTITFVPTAAISYAGNPFCMSVSAPQPVTLTGTGAYLGGTYTAAPAGLTIDPVTGAITPSTSTAGTYTITYTIPASGGCAAVPVTTSVTITVVPTAAISYAGNPFCISISVPQPVTLTGTGAYLGGTYTAAPAGLTIDPVTGAITPSTSTAGTYTVTYSIPASGGCAAVPVTTSVTINPLPVPSLSGPTPVCQASTGNVYTTDPGMSNYIWNVTGGTITAGSGTNAITVTWNTPGSQTVTVIYTDTHGCTAASPTVFNVTVTAIPTAAISYAGNPFCMSVSAPQPVTLTGTGAYLGGTYTAAPAGLTIDPITGAITPSTSTAGTYTVTYTIPASGGCAAVPVTTSVIINPLPIPTITGPTPVCLNSTNNIYTTQAGMTNYNWSVSAGGIITAGGTINDNTVTVTWTALGSQTVSVTYTNANGCTAASPTIYDVTVIPLPVTSPIYHK